MIIARGYPGSRSREAKTWACGTGPGPTVITNAMGVGTVALPRVRARERKWWAFGTGEVVEWLGAAPVHLMNETLSLPPECGASEVHAGCTPGCDSSQPLAYDPTPTVAHHSPVRGARRITPNDEIDEFIRRMDWDGPAVPAAVILENMRAELRAIRRRR